MSWDEHRSCAWGFIPRGDDNAPTENHVFDFSTRVMIVASVLFTFIGAWRTAAVVLCDLASTAYYIGGVVESQIGKAAPWFILAVMIFSYAVRSVYIESCSMFVRGGVYRVVKEAMGHTMAKISVSALMFDYVLTGPISAVSAGHYLVRLVNPLLGHFAVHERLGAAGVAVAVVLYFYQINVRGIPESTTKALHIMWATTAMAVVMIAWCLLTFAVRPETRSLPPWLPNWEKSSTGKASRRLTR
jgi:amino acid transporter